MIDKKRLILAAMEYGIDIEPIADKLDQYAQILVEYNKKVNLTAIIEPIDIENKHFLDSLFFAALPEVKGSLVDVGTGAGFPGIVAKLFKPDIELTLMEPTGKRVTFLKYACEELGIKANIAQERAEEAGHKFYRESFDVATARAVASLPTLAEYCLPLVKENGLFIAMKSESTEEIASSEQAFEILGGKFISVEKRSLPDGAARSLIIVKKISQTSTLYPRNGGRIAKKPL